MFDLPTNDSVVIYTAFYVLRQYHPSACNVLWPCRWETELAMAGSWAHVGRAKTASRSGTPQVCSVAPDAVSRTALLHCCIVEPHWH
jgi:hypothetical protein